MTGSPDAESYIDFLEREFSTPASTTQDLPTPEPGAAVSADVSFDWSELRSAVAPRSVVGPLFGVTKRDIDRAWHRLALDPEAVVPRQHVAKRVIDVCSAATAVMLLLPVFLVVIIAIRLDSRGPAITRQKRIGAGGRVFEIYKFRTLQLDADVVEAAIADGVDADGVLFKLRMDPRVTTVGRFLRRYWLDELPMLFNVLRGDMSLVGPRPALPAEVAHYDQVTRRRLLEKPGVTGLWQVSGRAELSWEDTVLLDLQYVDHWTMLRDLGVIVRTMRAVIRGSST